MFSESSPWLHGNTTAAVQPNGLWPWNILQNIFHNLPPQTVQKKIERLSQVFLAGAACTFHGAFTFGERPNAKTVSSD